MADETMNPAECGLKKQKKYIDVESVKGMTIDGWELDEIFDGIPADEQVKFVLGAAERKQIPMKPKRFIHKPTEKVMGVGDCPICGRLVSEWGKYCSQCGQRLDWGLKNET